MQISDDVPAYHQCLGSVTSREDPLGGVHVIFAQPRCLPNNLSRVSSGMSQSSLSCFFLLLGGPDSSDAGSSSDLSGSYSFLDACRSRDSTNSISISRSFIASEIHLRTHVTHWQRLYMLPPAGKSQLSSVTPSKRYQLDWLIARYLAICQ